MYEISSSKDFVTYYFFVFENFLVKVRVELKAPNL
jgi:hypothetical protein